MKNRGRPHVKQPWKQLAKAKTFSILGSSVTIALVKLIHLILQNDLNFLDVISQDTPSESNNTQDLWDLLAQPLFLDSRSAVLWGGQNHTFL